MPPNVVVGKRVSSKGLPPGLALYAAAVVLVVFAVLRFIDGDATSGVVLAVGAGVVAIVGVMFAGDAKRTSEIVSACPVCGIERQRKFIAWRGEPEPPSACGACLAYLRVNLGSLEVKEEAADATDGFYWVGAAQYQSVVPRGDDEQGRFKFQMPTMCAVCGAPEAPVLRTLSPMATADAGVIGAVASGVASEAAFDTGFAKANRRYESNTLSSGAELDLQLMDLQMHVCEQHTSIRHSGCEYKDGNLAFHSYRHYKAFCELNHITATPGR
jgi:hypothetical protein